ncbi:MAG: hypothetical protein WBM62_07320 [Crocosphaera sp.]
MTVFINEFHYDNSGTDVGEFIELAGLAGTNLDGWSIVLYNGANGTVYDTQTLSGTIANQSNGFGFVTINLPTNGLQNGSPDGIALVDDTGNVVQFISYEGSFTAVDGPAAGLTSTDIGVSESSSTLQMLVDAIAAAGGPEYAFIDNPFITDGLSGGQPGGNIRTAYLYNPNRVSLVNGSLQTIGSQAAGETFNGARLPLVATFDFNGEQVTVVDNHFSSKGGSAPILGVEQDFAARQEDPTVNGSLDERREQAQAVNDYVDGVLGTDPNANVVVLGDLNEFEFVSPLDILAGTTVSINGGQDIATGGNAVLTNLINNIAEDERYSFNFQGNSQQLDHLLVTDGLLPNAEIDIVHVNTEFLDIDSRASDHDPVVASFTL